MTRPDLLEFALKLEEEGSLVGLEIRPSIIILTRR